VLRTDLAEDLTVAAERTGVVVVEDNGLRTNPLPTDFGELTETAERMELDDDVLFPLFMDLAGLAFMLRKVESKISGINHATAMRN